LPALGHRKKTMATSSATAVHITLLSGRSERFAVDRSTKVEELKAWAQKSFGQGDVGKKYIAWWLYHFGLLLNHVIGHLYPFLSIYDDWGCYNYVFFGL